MTGKRVSGKIQLQIGSEESFLQNKIKTLFQLRRKRSYLYLSS